MKGIFKIIFLTLFLFTSCVKELDFNQLKDIEISPVVKATLFNFTIKEEQLVYADGSEAYELEDSSDLTDFIINDNLEQLDLEFKIENQFDRVFELDFYFLNDNVEVYKISLEILNNKRNFTHIEEIVIANNPIILSANRVKSVLRLLPSRNGEVVGLNGGRKFEFQSSANLHLRYNTGD